MLTLKKSLGQHFLKDESILDRTMELLLERPFTRLLEVGPGGGALTRRLLGLSGIELRLVEIDPEKVRYLRRIFPGLEGRLIQGDILRIPEPFKEPFTVIGNFPYQVSTGILFRMLEWRAHLETMVGMFQKEVAQRVAARPGSRVYGVTSVLVQAWFSVEYLLEVPPEAFDPPPRVDSAVIRLSPRPDPPDMYSEGAFNMLVKTAFNQRRKTLRNATKSLFDPEVLREPLFDRRPEQLGVEEFATLSFRMKSLAGSTRRG